MPNMPFPPFLPNPIIPVAQNGLDQNEPQAPAPFVFDNDDWKRTENPNGPIGPVVRKT